MAELSVSFEIYNKEAVKRLQEENPDILPVYKVSASKDLAYNKKQINAAVTSAIIQGKSIDGIAKDLQNRMESLNRNSAIKTARTAITNAQNAGSLSSMKELAEMGVAVQKEWVATLDDRTRESHRKLDGERRDLDERFSNGLMYPGASGSAKEVWNCRCTMVSYVPDVDTSDATRWSRDPNTGRREYVPNQTYKEWYASRAPKSLPQDLDSDFRMLVRAKLDTEGDWEYRAWLEQEWKKLVPTDITDDDWVRTRVYIQTPASFSINRALRENPDLSIREAMQKAGFLEKDINNMEFLVDLINKHSLEQNTMLIRNSDYLDGLGMTHDALQAFIEDFSADEQAAVCSQFAGLRFAENNMVSTSGSEAANVFTNRQIQLKIKAPAGTNALITSNAYESEVILPRGTTYEIEGAEIVAKENEWGRTHRLLELTVRVVQ